MPWETLELWMWVVGTATTQAYLILMPETIHLLHSTFIIVILLSSDFIFVFEHVGMVSWSTENQ